MKQRSSWEKKEAIFYSEQVDNRTNGCQEYALTIFLLSRVNSSLRCLQYVYCVVRAGSGYELAIWRPRQ